MRNLERQIGKICRKIAAGVAAGDIKRKRTVKVKDLNTYLGKRKFFDEEVAERAENPGVAIGLAWTEAGGDIMFFEATKVPGNKGFTLTGQLGDVMKESAQAAFSYVRSRAESLGLDPEFFNKSDIHLHIPAGAIPKDGPSAGITMATALASLLTGPSRAPQAGHDRRDHAARQGAAGRRHQGEGAGGAALRPADRHPAQAATRPTSTTCPKPCASA